MAGKTHILFISSWYPNRNNPTHGIFNKAFAEAAALYNTISVLHVCSDEHLATDFEIVEQQQGPITTVTVYYRKVTSGIPLFSLFKKRQRVLQSFDLGFERLTNIAGQPDLIQLNVVMPSGIGLLHLSKKHKLPYVVNEGWTGYYAEDGSYRGFLLKYYTGKVLAGARRIMPVSDRLKLAMLAHGLKGEYRIVPNVVDTSFFVPREVEQQTANIFLHISTLDDRQKNVSGIIRAFANALKKNAALKLVIVGEGPDSKALQKLGEQLKVAGNIIFCGKLTGEHLVSKINECDALVMFSNYETFCLTVAEALACGKPVITSRAGGLTDQITNSLGISVNIKDEIALSDALVDFKNRNSQFDPAAMRAFITANFTPEKIGKQLTEIYNSVLHEKNN